MKVSVTSTKGCFGSMLPKQRLCLVLLLASALLISSAATAGTVKVFFWADGVLRAVDKPAAPGVSKVEAALYALALGPSLEEEAAGLGSAVPKGTWIQRVDIDDRKVAVDFSSEILSDGFGDAKLVDLFDQVRWTVWMNGPEKDVVLTCGGAPLSSFLPPTPVITPGVVGELAAVGRVQTVGSALSGKKITVSPGHGKVWTGSAYGFQRGITCSSTGLAREDDHDLEICQYLEQYLLSDGATAKMARCTNKNYGTHTPSGEPWWRVCSVNWLANIGYPCTVWGSTTDCSPGSGSDEFNDDIRARPLSSDYDASDIFFSLHTNALSGDCTGSGCPTGSDIFYDCSTEHAAWCDVSRTLEQNVYAHFLTRSATRSRTRTGTIMVCTKTPPATTARFASPTGPPCSSNSATTTRATTTPFTSWTTSSGPRRCGASTRVCATTSA